MAPNDTQTCRQDPWSNATTNAKVITMKAQCGNDQGQLVPLIEATENNLGRKPEQASADSGYCSEANLEALEAHGIDGYDEVVPVLPVVRQLCRDPSPLRLSARRILPSRTARSASTLGTTGTASGAVWQARCSAD
jgi:hypothetical protein